MTVNLVVLGICPRFIFTHASLRVIILCWNLLLLLFQTGYVALATVRFVYGMSTKFKFELFDFILNFSLHTSRLWTLILVLGVRLWVVVYGDMLHHQRFKTLYIQILGKLRPLQLIHKESWWDSWKLSVNEVIFLLIFALSNFRHCLLEILLHGLFSGSPFEHLYMAKPVVWPINLEFAVKLAKALFLEVTILDVTALLIIFLAKELEKLISVLNNKIYQNLEVQKVTKNENGLFSKRNAPQPLDDILKKIEKFYGDLVSFWSPLQGVVGQATLICFTTWMGNISFDIFLSYTSTADIGFNQYTFVYQFMAVATTVKFGCLTSAAHTLRQQV